MVSEVHIKKTLKINLWHKELWKFGHALWFEMHECDQCWGGMWGDAGSHVESPHKVPISGFEGQAFPIPSKH